MPFLNFYKILIPFFLVMVLISCQNGNIKKDSKKNIIKKIYFNNILNSINNISKPIKWYNDKENFEYICKLRKFSAKTVDGIEQFLKNDKLFTITIVAVGDIIPHGMVKKTALYKKNGKNNPDFDFLIKDIKKYLKGDIIFGNLETPILPNEDVWRSIPYRFNIPVKMVKMLKKSGFNFLSVVNNHSYDQGVKGVVSTIKVLKKLKLKYIGIGNSYKDGIKPIIFEKKGVKIGFLGYTDLINNDKNSFNPEDKKTKKFKNKPYVNRLYPKIALKEIKKLRKKVDILIVSVHWGVEYHKKPWPRQTELSKKFFKAGADIILGHHPHVLQQIKFHKTKKGNKLIIYSMGNFISNQFFPLKRKAARHKEANREGIILKINITNKNGKIKVDNFNYIPTYIKKHITKDMEKDYYRIYVTELNPKKDKLEYKKYISFMGLKSVYIDVYYKIENYIKKYIY